MNLKIIFNKNDVVYRLDSDGAHHWIVIDYILTGKSVALHPYGLTHLGITDFIFSIPFSLLLGHTQYSYQLMLHLVFLLLSFSIYKITQFAYGQKASDYSLLLLALPNPILYHFLVRPYGGHLLGSVIVILSLLLLFVSEKKENKIPYLCLSSFLVSFAYYTSHLSIIPLLPLNAVKLRKIGCCTICRWYEKKLFTVKDF